MTGIPQHTRWLVERLLAAYCARICPPQVRSVVQLGFTLEHDRATLEELRPICGVPGTRRPMPLAQFRYDEREQLWRLFHADESGRWRRYAARPASPRFIDLLRELDADPNGTFWCRIDGKSLRWCSSRGRCAECDAKYCRVLGLQGS
ncbi:MAG: DUF3024 domain-containing protein [Steroidobacteraceae bacterium]